MRPRLTCDLVARRGGRGEGLAAAACGITLIPGVPGSLVGGSSHSRARHAEPTMTVDTSAAVSPRSAPSADLFWLAAAWRGCRKQPVGATSAEGLAARSGQRNPKTPGPPQVAWLMQVPDRSGRWWP